MSESEASSPLAARLASQLKCAIDGAWTEPRSTAAQDPIRAKFEAMVTRGLLMDQDNPFNGLPQDAQILSPGDETLRLTANRVQELLQRFDFDDERLERLSRIHSITANSGIPSAFTTAATDGYVLVLDNMTHDYMYSLLKLLFLATDPPDPEDPTWRAEGESGRFYACSRLIHDLESSLRWRGVPVLPVTPLIPHNLLEYAIQAFMEPVQIFIVAHEYAHVILDHFSEFATRADLALGPVSATTVQTDLNVEIAADLIATSVLVHDALEVGEDFPAAVAQAASVVQFALAAIDRFTENYFLVPPLTHPPAQARLDACVRLLNQWPGGHGDWVERRPSLQVFPALLGKSQRAFSGMQEFLDFLGLLERSKYFIRNARAELILEEMQDWERYQEAWGALDSPEAFRCVVDVCLGPQAGMAAIEAAIRFRVGDGDFGPAALMDHGNQAVFEIGAKLLDDLGRNDSLAGFRRWFSSVKPGLTFRNALGEVSTMTPPDMLLACLKVVREMPQAGP